MTSRSEQSTRLWISIGRTFGNLEYWDTNVMNLLATYLTNEQAVNALDLMQVVTLTAGLFKIRFVDQGAFEGIGRRTLDILKDRASKNDFPLNHAARWKSTLQIVSTLVHANVTYAPLMDYLYDRVLEGAQNGQLESAMSGEGIANQYLATELKRAFSHLLWCFTVTQHHLLPDFHHILRVVLKCYDFRQDSNVYRKLFQTVDAFQHESLPSLPTTTPHLDDLTAMCDAVITWPEGPQNLNKGFGEDYAFRRNWAHDTSEILDRLGVSHEVFYRSPDLPHVVDLAVVTQPPPPPTPAPAPPPAAPVPQPQPPQPPVDAAPSSTTTTTKPGSKRMVIVEDETDSDTEEQDQHTQRQQQQQQQQPAVDARAETTMVNGAEREEEGSGRVSATLEGLAEGKNKGNEAFMRGNIDEAVQWFSECIDLCEAGKVPGVEEPTTAPTSPPVSEGTKLLSFLYSNRSQAFLKLERWEDAERDGRRAFEVNPDNIKAAYKCAVAMSRQGAGKLDEALKTVQTVVDYHVARKVESREAVELKANILKQIVEQQDKRRAVSARTQATSALRLSKLAVPPVPPNPPRSAYELQRVWNSLKHHPDEQARYLRQRVTPDAIKRAFVKSSIEPDLLAEILKRMTEDTERTEGEKMTHEQVAGLLDALLSTYQASVQFKMLSSSELGHFRSLLTRLGDSQVARSVEGKAAHMGIAATAIAGR
mmetsp:Transcript_24657/g.71150  ORF Transcript_24657/g.71150 Transcript_24657/m.71150 type:complete len:706 (-) Transcript_24657:1096-3213(-)